MHVYPLIFIIQGFARIVFRILFGWTKKPFPSANSGLFFLLWKIFFFIMMWLIPSILASVVFFSGNMWFLGWFSVLQIITPSCSHLLSHLKVFFFFFSFFSIFWRSRWFKFYPVRSAIYSADVDFNCAIASIASLQGFFFFFLTTRNSLFFSTFLFYIVCDMVLVSRKPFTLEWSHLWFSDIISLRPIVMEDVNNV